MWLKWTLLLLHWIITIISSSLSIIIHLICGSFIKLSDHCLSGSGGNSWLHFLPILGLLDTCMVVSFSQVEENYNNKKKNTLIICIQLQFYSFRGFPEFPETLVWKSYSRSQSYLCSHYLILTTALLPYII